MDDIWTRFSSDLIDRVSGPMRFRLVLQPLMAVVYAILSGLKDAREGKPPYFWGLARYPETRVAMLEDGWKHIAKVFVLAIVLDVVYQFIVRRFVYPGEAIVVAVILAIVPYVIVRGIVERIARAGEHPHAKGPR